MNLEVEYCLINFNPHLYRNIMIKSNFSSGLVIYYHRFLMNPDDFCVVCPLPLGLASKWVDQLVFTLTRLSQNSLHVQECSFSTYLLEKKIICWTCQKRKLCVKDAYFGHTILEKNNGSFQTGQKYHLLQLSSFSWKWVHLYFNFLLLIF